ncbi:hypothetical protein PJI21_29480, partial [Mycobacterium kansasii]
MSELPEEKPAAEDASKPKKGKASKEPKQKKSAAPKKPKSAPTHPSYLEMTADAITTLKERNGS